MSLFKFCFSIFLFSFASIITNGQDLLKYGWSHEQINSANTAKDCKYLNEDEKKVILLVNLSRITPQKFSEVMLAMWFENTSNRFLFAQMCSIEYSNSLIADLQQCSELNPLIPNKKLFQLAEVHAKNMGEKGKTGHARRYNYTIAERMKGLNRRKNFAENCSYGCKKPIDIVMQLLVDNEVPSLGHRKNILNKSNSEIGVAIRAHKKYTYNCVMDLGT